MISFDTNLVVHAANLRATEQRAAAAFLQSLGNRNDVMICELMLVDFSSSRALHSALQSPRLMEACTP